MRIKLQLLAMMCVIIGITCPLVYGQYPAPNDKPAEQTTEQPIERPAGPPADKAAEAPLAETQWLWGEVKSVDPQSKQLNIEYIDYENDQKKEIVIYADDKTTYENVGSFDYIKLNDGVSIDYTTNAEGKNYAQNIGVEKMDEQATVSPEAAAEGPAQAVPLTPPQ